MKHKLFFVLTTLVPAALDGIFTLAGQPVTYWTDFHKYNESAPIQFLSFGPIIFILSFLAYLFILGFIIYKLPKWWSVAVGLGFTLGHTIGLMSWVPYMMVSKFHISYGAVWYVIPLYSGILSIAITFSLRHWLMNEKRKK